MLRTVFLRPKPPTFNILLITRTPRPGPALRDHRVRDSAHLVLPPRPTLNMHFTPRDLHSRRRGRVEFWYRYRRAG